MPNLYGKRLAGIYDKIYQGFIDYEEEYNFYAQICKQHQARSVLEIGCGSGNLAKPFANNFKTYTGLDYSAHMLEIARSKFSNGHFLKADMRNFMVSNPYEAVLITGRSSSYLLTDDDLKDAFGCIYSALDKSGIFVFDCIDAELFIPFIEKNGFVEHQCEVSGVKFSRETIWFHDRKMSNHMIDWSADYYQHEHGEKNFLGNDKVIFRVFTKDEIGKLLNDDGFEILKIEHRKTYAFDTFVIVARKII